MAKPKKDKGVLAYRLILTFIIVLAVGGFAIAYWSQKPTNQPVADSGKLAALAECLTSKGAKMYGTYWCPHCQQQKKDFGIAFEKINYIECAVPNDPRAPQVQACADAGIKGYPTWMWPDGSTLEGDQSFKNLADKAGCPWTE
jgi:hypothetical protein